MLKKVHISDAKTATFVCPRCDNTKTVDASRYIERRSRTKVRSKCTCGCTWTSILERRKSFRVAVKFTGVCMHRGAKGPVDSIPVNIVDLSSTGLRIEQGDSHGLDPSDFRLDDLISMDFHLNDRTMTHVRKTAVVKNISPQCIGAEFEASKQRDPAIDAYILSQRLHQMVV
jgi:hypothetical protein